MSLSEDGAPATPAGLLVLVVHRARGLGSTPTAANPKVQTQFSGSNSGAQFTPNRSSNPQS